MLRVREHVNPLSQRYAQPVALPVWAEIFADLSQPLHLDIGCAKGRFVQAMAQLQPHWNYLGLEIRQPLVDQGNQWRDRQGLTNLHHLFCNANVSLAAVLASLPSDRLHQVSIQFPDPWFKKRHQKRRVLQPQLVQDLAQFLPPAARVFVQSDIEKVAVEMRDRLLTHPAFSLTHPLPWRPDNPFPIATERERCVLARQEPVYRAEVVKG